jgi:cold shock CspA family protein
MKVGLKLFVRQTSLSGDIRATLSEGTRVEFERREGGMGPEAIDVLPLAEGSRR